MIDVLLGMISGQAASGRAVPAGA
ncbi:hypothetical protein IBTHAUMO2_1010007 [Nitrosopumilaceae archaeon]|nr:hypothetical protein IBTHAUMO2_1010007 [Nitrosopumilaceae archaeon]